MKKLIIFTDLDGTLLDHYTYSFEKALPALQLLKEKGIPLIVCSSKTRKEIEYYRRKLDNHDPFVSENGGGVYIPKDLGFRVQDSRFKIEENSKYQIIRLGAKYSDLRKAVEELQKDGFGVKGFGDMTAEELAEIANMSLEEAMMAKERDFDEPFVFDGSKADEQGLLEAIISKGFNYTQGRFFHILGGSDKGKAVSILIELYEKKFDKIITIAIGDSPNDIPMLERVDYPVIVQKPDESYDPRINIPNLTMAEGIGPDGWNKVVLNFIAH